MVDSHIRVKQKINKTEKLQKESVMPTWQGALHLILKHRAKITNKDPPVKTNSQVISPVLRSSLKDLLNLYTALKMCPNISFEAVDPNRRVVVTLDVDLYKPALQIQISTGNKQWLL